MAGEEDGVSLGEGEVVRSTEKALLVQLESGDTKWIPKSVIHDDSEVYEEAGDASAGDVVVMAWWARKEGLD